MDVNKAIEAIRNQQFPSIVSWHVCELLVEEIDRIRKENENLIEHLTRIKNNQ